jgi:hypothetical protein
MTMLLQLRMNAFPVRLRTLMSCFGILRQTNLVAIQGFRVQIDASKIPFVACGVDDRGVKA